MVNGFGYGAGPVPNQLQFSSSAKEDNTRHAAHTTDYKELGHTIGAGLASSDATI
jgi:hypothetical protein